MTQRINSGADWRTQETKSRFLRTWEFAKNARTNRWDLFFAASGAVRDAKTETPARTGLNSLKNYNWTDLIEFGNFTIFVFDGATIH